MKGKSNKTFIIFLCLLILLSVNFITEAASPHDPLVSIGNITRIKGIRDNQLMGYGLVIGLAGTGDSNRSQATVQSVANMLQNFGVEVTSQQIRSRNVAAVIVTANLPPFAHNGDQIDVTVSSMGDADSLQGGTLLQTPLRAANNEVYAVAQGPVSIGGFNTQAGGSQVRENHPTVGRIPDGALVEKELNYSLDREKLTYLLRSPSFETANYIAQAINDNFKYLTGQPTLARPIDAGKIQVKVPDSYQDQVVDFIAKINNLEVRSSTEAKVVIDEKTGTIVMSHNVRISTVAVAHGNLTVTITTEKEVSQPPSFSEGETKVTEEKKVEVEEEEGHLVVVESKQTLQDLVNALNMVGASPRDIISIIQKIKAAGALHAEIELN